jgi:hypothetical protein
MAKGGKRQKRPKHLDPVTEFPRLTKSSHRVTSDEDAQYNCIAYAAGITDKKFWPKWYPDYVWPPGLPKVETVIALEKFYETFGYARANNGDYVHGVEKIAIYATADGKPTHAARQVDDKTWTSKLGGSYDIEHSHNSVSGGTYGEITVYMARSKKSK